MSAYYQFLKGETSLHTDERLALMAVCVATQQSAGFKRTIDIREWSCPSCRSPGFNTGLGYVRFTCGAEHTVGDDGLSTPCGVAA